MGILVVAPFLLCVLTWNQVEPDSACDASPRRCSGRALLGASAFAMWNRVSSCPAPPLVGWIAWRFQLRGRRRRCCSVHRGHLGRHRMVGCSPTFTYEEMLTLQLSTRRSRSRVLPLGARLRTHAVRERLQRAADDLEGRVRPAHIAAGRGNEHLGRQITERREAEIKLRASEHELAEAQELARLGRWEWDLETGTVTWSDDLYRIHGYEPGAFPMTFDKAVELVPEEDRQRIERNLATAFATRGRELPHIEYRIVRPEGELRTLLGRARMFFDEAGSPVRMLGVVQDITERVDYDRQHLIAETLQRALLPQDLPMVDGLALAARYLPAEVGFKAGGDWYDVIPLAGGRVGLVIGDVAGHGLEAASVMGQLRMAVRAYALEGHQPADIVEHADAVLRVVASDEIATMTYGEVHPASGAVRIVGAGHPPPIAIDADGARYLDLPKQPPIGVAAGWAYEEVLVDIAPGAKVVLYTDGLIDRRDIALEEGLEQLLAAADRDPGRPVETVCRDLITELAPSEAADDIALLAMERLRVPAEAFRFRMPAEPAELARMRRRARGLAPGHRGRAGRANDLVPPAPRPARTPSATRTARAPGRWTSRPDATTAPSRSSSATSAAGASDESGRRPRAGADRGARTRDADRAE